MDATQLLAASHKENLRIRLKGRLLEVLGQHDEVLLIHAAIATPYLYANFLPSLAHLKEDGSVWHYGKKIGDSSDIELVATIEA